MALDETVSEGLIHIVAADTWAAGVPVAGAEGFLHLCTPGQVPFVLGRFFAGQAGLVALHLDPAALEDVRWEASEPGMAPFPHLYSPLPADAVTRVEALPPHTALPPAPAAG